jgi:CheY-like chemotaxis protein
LIFLDLAMPELSSVDVLARVSQEFPDVPVIVMIGYVI